MSDTIKVTANFTEDEWEAIRECAARDGLEWDEMFRVAIREYLAEPEDPSPGDRQDS